MQRRCTGSGELLLRQAIPDETQAETCLHQALDIARHQQTRAWELRAAVSLARLWQRQGKRTAAQQRLVEIYGWFTEGFDTVDLQEAKVLLEELKASTQGQSAPRESIKTACQEHSLCLLAVPHATIAA